MLPLCQFSHSNAVLFLAVVPFLFVQDHAIVLIFVTLLFSNNNSVHSDNGSVSAIVSRRPVLPHYKGSHAAVTVTTSIPKASIMFGSNPTQTQPSLTFGVEFEFVLSTYEEGTRDPLSERRPGVFPTSLVRNNKEISREQAEQLDDYTFQEYRPPAQAIADMLQQNGTPAFPWFRAARSSIGVEDESG